MLAEALLKSANCAENLEAMVVMQDVLSEVSSHDVPELPLTKVFSVRCVGCTACDS